jgi:hypothetical protein
MAIFPYKSASHLSTESEAETSWLVREIWGEGAVGILGGEPKCCKSFLALDIAIAVSSGQPCLGKFAVDRPGRVVLYAAEDSPDVVKRRLSGIAAARGLMLNECDIQVITTERLRLDQIQDVESLGETVAELRPRLLILDPFVRLHRIDENSSSEVAMILDNLRTMQRQHKMAIMIVHHAKKNGGSIRAGQALRGSSEFHAWGDSNLYLRRVAGGNLSLSIEHRAAKSRSGIPIALLGDDSKLALEITETNDEIAPSVAVSSSDRVISVLAARPEALTLSDLRKLCGIRTASLCAALKILTDAGQIRKSDVGFTLVMQ